MATPLGLNIDAAIRMGLFTPTPGNLSLDVIGAALHSAGILAPGMASYAVGQTEATLENFLAVPDPRQQAVFNAAEQVGWLSATGGPYAMGPNGPGGVPPGNFAYLSNAPALIPGVDFSDHASYWAEGFPALMITDTAFFRNHNYHQAGDTYEKLDYNRMAQVVQSVYAITQKF